MCTTGSNFDAVHLITHARAHLCLHVRINIDTVLTITFIIRIKYPNGWVLCTMGSHVDAVHLITHARAHLCQHVRKNVHAMLRITLLVRIKYPDGFLSSGVKLPYILGLSKGQLTTRWIGRCIFLARCYCRCSKANKHCFWLVERVIHK